MKEKEYYVHKVIEFVDCYFPNSLGVLLTGSITTGYFNETSDLDIVLLSNLYRNTFIESYLFDDLKMQVIIFPMYDLDNIFYRDVAQGNGAYIKMFTTGVILRDQIHILTKIKKRALDLYEQGPRPISEFNIDRIRSLITSRLEDLEGNKDFCDNFFTGLEAYNYLLTLYLKCKREWNYTGKIASRELREKHPEFHDRFVNSFKDFVSQNNTAFLVDFIRENLEQSGGELHFFSSRHFSEKIEKDSLVIFVANSLNSDLRDKLLNLSIDFARYIENQISDICYFSFFQSDKKIFRSGLYIIFYYPQKKIEEYLLPLVELFHSKLITSSFSDILDEWYYPYQLNPLEVLGSRDAQLVIMKYLSCISSQFNDKQLGLDEEKSIGYCLFVLKHIRQLECFRDNSSLWFDFCDFVYNLLLMTDNKELLPGQIIEFYAKLNDERCRKKYLEEGERYSDYLLKTESVKIRDLLLEIENIYNHFPNSYCFSLEEDVLKDRFPLQQKKILLIVLKIIEYTQNTLWIKNKSFVIYCLLKGKI